MEGSVIYPLYLGKKKNHIMLNFQMYCTGYRPINTIM